MRTKSALLAVTIAVFGSLQMQASADDVADARAGLLRFTNDGYAGLPYQVVQIAVNGAWGIGSYRVTAPGNGVFVEAALYKSPRGWLAAEDQAETVACRLTVGTPMLNHRRERRSALRSVPQHQL